MTYSIFIATHQIHKTDIQILHILEIVTSISCYFYFVLVTMQIHLKMKLCNGKRNDF